MSDDQKRIWVHVATGEVSLEKPERHWEFQDFDTIQSAMTAARIEGAQMALVAAAEYIKGSLEQQRNLCCNGDMCGCRGVSVGECESRAIRNLDPAQIVKGGDK